jgi:alkylation response protein AidB-like acyl-CoA dehydrogenase
MPDYTPPLADYRFVLHEALKIDEETAIDGYAELTPDLTGAVLAEACKIASEVLAPLNPVGDRQGCVLENGAVRTPEGFADAYRLLCEGGWPAMECDPAHGGQGMPAILNLAAGTMMSAANLSFMMYSGLTHGA